MNDIVVRGARTHNLKNIDVTIPKNKLVVITGLSGSGKSSLAFDTLYAEGQRRYVESVSAYARQFLEQMEKPDVDSIEGLSPAISIEQRNASRNPRSTVGTATEIYDYLRLLFARAGRPHCPECRRPIAMQTVSQMVDRVRELPEGTKIVILSPIVRGRKGEFAKELSAFSKKGFVRVCIDGVMHELSDEIVLDKKKKHDIDVVIDRLSVSSNISSRLADSLETALAQSEGLVKIEWKDQELLLSEKHACVYCGVSLPEITPQLFSFNNPRGACPSCEGLGTRRYLDPNLIVPNVSLSLREGALVPWQSRSPVHTINIFEALAKHYHFSITTPFGGLPQKVRDVIFFGSGDENISFRFDSSAHQKNFKTPFEGIIPQMERRYAETTSEEVRESISRFMNRRPCPTCTGARLRKESLCVTVGEKTIAEMTALPLRHCREFLQSIDFTKKERAVSERVMKEILERIGFLIDVGLDYLTLDRTSSTLAGGEDQRIRLATQIGSQLTGVLYVLDEPSIGLHPRDHDRLLATLKRLRDLGNTVLVVEHDSNTMRAADEIIDLGPGAGVHGGEVIATGSVQKIMKSAASLTGGYLSGRLQIKTPTQRRKSSGALSIINATEHNLKNLTVDIPLACFVCVTGVSGSGKSTLVNDTLLAGLKQRLYHSQEPAGKIGDIRGWKELDKVIDIDQSPIGRTPRSNPATYTGLFSFIRDLFAELPQSKARGYKPGRFSFNVKGGRCEACEGDGVIRIEMHFLPDVHVECEVCQGMRFNRETLDIHYKGKSIAEVLSMTVNQALRFFENIPPIRQKLETLIDVGMGYVELGQSATTLSGGEAQRIKLSRELSRRATGKTLYILDEPTTGLHFDDVQKLIDVINRLVDHKNSVIVIEHNVDVIKNADWCIDLGPEGGEGGGHVIATGTPEELAKHPNSFTGKYLRGVL